MKLVTFRVVVRLVSVSLVSAGLAWSPASVHAQDRSLSENPELAAYFEDEVSQLEKQNDLNQFNSLDEWQEAKPRLREQLFDMLGLSPRPEKTDLQAAITGTTEEEEFVVERVHFQSQSHVPLFVDAVLPENQTLDSLKSAAIHVAADPESVFREVLKDRTKDSDAVFVMSPRGLGPHQWIGAEVKQNQIQRRFQLIGTTADAMRVWDIRRAIQSVQTACPNLSAPPTAAGDQMLEPHVLLASLFEPSAAPQSLHHTSADPNQWPSILNLTRTISPKELISLVIWRSGVKGKSSSAADALLDLGQKLSSDSRWTGASVLLEDD